jgi:hypothetical protein
MFKVISLIVMGIILATSGLYLASIGAFMFKLPDVNWAGIGFVMVVGSAVSFGTAFIASRVR